MLVFRKSLKVTADNIVRNLELNFFLMNKKDIGKGKLNTAILLPEFKWKNSVFIGLLIDWRFSQFCIISVISWLDRRWKICEIMVVRLGLESQISCNTSPALIHYTTAAPSNVHNEYFVIWHKCYGEQNMIKSGTKSYLYEVTIKFF